MAERVERGDRGRRFCITSNGEKGAGHARCGNFDLILLDPHLPDMRGPEILKRFRADDAQAPIVIVSDAAGVADMSRSIGFEADAYVTVPSGGAELVALTYRLTRYARKPPFIVKAGGHTLKFSKRWLKIDGEGTVLSRYELQIVELLAHRRGEILSRKDLCDHLFGWQDDAKPRMVDSYVSRARSWVREGAGTNSSRRFGGRGTGSARLRTTGREG